MSINLISLGATDPTKQVHNDPAAKAVTAKSQPPVQKTATEDTATFSSTASSVQSLSQSAIETAHSRQAKVEALRQAVSSAQYQLDSAKITESLVNADV